MGRDYRKIEAYIIGKELVESVYKITKLYPRAEIFGLVSQMRRAAVSVPSNIAEGAARKSKKEYIHFLSIALGSLAELECQIDISKRLEYIDEIAFNKTEEIRSHVGAKLFRLMEAIEKEI